MSKTIYRTAAEPVESNFNGTISWVVFGESVHYFDTEEEAIKDATNRARKNNREYKVVKEEVVARVRPAKDVEVVRE